MPAAEMPRLAAPPDKGKEALLALLAPNTPRLIAAPIPAGTSAYERFVTDQNRASISKDRAMLPDRKLPTTRGLPDSVTTPRSPRSPRSPGSPRSPRRPRAPHRERHIVEPASFPDPVSAVHLIPTTNPPDSDEEPPLKTTRRQLEVQRERAEQERLKEERRRAPAESPPARREAAGPEEGEGKQRSPRQHISIATERQVREFKRDPSGPSPPQDEQQTSGESSPSRRRPFLRALSRTSIRSVKSSRTEGGRPMLGLASVSFASRGKSFWRKFVDPEKGGAVAAEFRPEDPDARLSLAINYDVFNFYSRANLLPGVPKPSNPSPRHAGAASARHAAAAAAKASQELGYDLINFTPRQGGMYDVLHHEEAGAPLPPHQMQRRASIGVVRNGPSAPYPLLAPPPAEPEPRPERYVPEWWEPSAPVPPIVAYLRNRRIVETRDVYEGYSPRAAGASTARF